MPKHPPRRIYLADLIAVAMLCGLGMASSPRSSPRPRRSGISRSPASWRWPGPCSTSVARRRPAGNAAGGSSIPGKRPCPPPARLRERAGATGPVDPTAEDDLLGHDGPVAAGPRSSPGAGGGVLRDPVGDPPAIAILVMLTATEVLLLMLLATLGIGLAYISGDGRRIGRAVRVDRRSRSMSRPPRSCALRVEPGTCSPNSSVGSRPRGAALSLSRDASGDLRHADALAVGRGIFLVGTALSVLGLTVAGCVVLFGTLTCGLSFQIQRLRSERLPRRWPARPPAQRGNSSARGRQWSGTPGPTTLADAARADGPHAGSARGDRGHAHGRGPAPVPHLPRSSPAPSVLPAVRPRVRLLGQGRPLYLERSDGLCILCTALAPARLADPRRIASLSRILTWTRARECAPPPWLQSGLPRLANAGDRDALARLDRKMAVVLACGTALSVELFRMTNRDLGRLLSGWRDPATYQKARQFQLQAWSIVEYLAGAATAEGGPTPLGAFLTNPLSRRHAEESFRHHFGRGQAELLDDWRRWLATREIERPEPPPPTSAR